MLPNLFQWWLINQRSFLLKIQFLNKNVEILIKTIGILVKKSKLFLKIECVLKIQFFVKTRHFGGISIFRTEIFVEGKSQFW